jgi:cytochrome P450
LFRLFHLTRRRAAIRVGRRVIINDADLIRGVLTDLPLDRANSRTTGGLLRAHAGAGTLFDEAGEQHKTGRRAIAKRLGPSGRAPLRDAWTPVLDDACRRLEQGERVDVCDLAIHIAGATALAILERVDCDPREVARAALADAAAAAVTEIPGPRRRPPHRPGARLDRIMPVRTPLETTLLVAAVNTTVATIPRAVAWTADAQLWSSIEPDGQVDVLVAELLRVLAPTPVLPRVPLVTGQVGRYAVGPNDQLALFIRRAVRADSDDPDVHCPQPDRIQRLVFGAGPHACPGAGVARAQLGDVLTALAPLRPIVTDAVADRRSALPSWAQLVIRAHR